MFLVPLCSSCLCVLCDFDSFFASLDIGVSVVKLFRSLTMSSTPTLRTLACVLIALLLAGCAEQSTRGIPVPVKGAYPSLGYTDAEIAAMRQTLASARYPQPEGFTLHALGLRGIAASSQLTDDYKPNAQNLVASVRRTYPLNGRDELLIVENHFSDKQGLRIF